MIKWQRRKAAKPRSYKESLSFVPLCLCAFVPLCLCAFVPPFLCAQGGADVGVSTPALTVEQFYRPVGARDPLKVSTVYTDEKGPKSRNAVADIARATFSVYNLSLAGIMEDARSKEAMLTDSATGLVYTLKAGLLLDSKKRRVPGVSGVIKGKQVILMTDDKKIHQLTLRQKE